jgi:hypothetical protein
MPTSDLGTWGSIYMAFFFTISYPHGVWRPTDTVGLRINIDEYYTNTPPVRDADVESQINKLERSRRLSDKLMAMQIRKRRAKA